MLVKEGLGDIEKAIASIRRCPRPVPLFCGVQFYAWGDSEYIPRLLGIDNPHHKPFAELWIGAHPDLPAEAVIGGVRVRLDRLLEEAPETLLGPKAMAEYQGELPFLLKILAAARPLSIQVHPDREQAEKGYALEDARGIPLDSPRRNYRDRHHKPELLCALTPFYLLKGFRPEAEIAEVLAAVPEWKGLSDCFQQKGLRGFYSHLMTLPQVEVNALLEPLLARLRNQPEYAKDQPEYWLLLADELYSQGGNHDRGLFSILLLNFLCLQPGEGVFQGAGELHAYLQGVGVEIMANSNNVLRGGLTPKHVDVSALLDVLKFQGCKAQVLSPKYRGAEAVYEVPAREFLLSRIELERGRPFRSSGPLRLGIVLEGEVEVLWGDGRIRLRKGQSYLIPHGCRCSFHPRSTAIVYQGACRY